MDSPTDPTQRDKVHTGQYVTIEFGIGPAGLSPAKEYWDSLNDTIRARWFSCFRHLDNPQRTYGNKQRIKHLKGELYEFKDVSLNTRVFTYRDGNAWVLVSAFTEKKQQKLARRVLERALTTMRAMQEQDALRREKSNED